MSEKEEAEEEQQLKYNKKVLEKKECTWKADCKKYGLDPKTTSKTKLGCISMGEDIDSWDLRILRNIKGVAKPDSGDAY